TSGHQGGPEAMNPFQTQVLVKPAAERREELKTNEDVFALWTRFNGAIRMQDVTREHYGHEIRSYLRACGTTLATAVKEADLWDYVVQYARGCGSYGRLWGGPPICRAGFNVTQCGFSCPGYTPREPSTVDNHLQALSHLYKLLARHGHVQANIAEPVRKQWKASNRGRPGPSKIRILEAGEILTLVTKAQAPYIRLAAATMAKEGFRPEEVLRLTVEASCLDRARGTLTLPFRPGKRKIDSNHVGIIDSELDRMIGPYLAWRERVLVRSRKATSSLLVTSRGDPLTYDHLARRLTQEAERLELQTPKCPRAKKMNAHTFRHFFSTHIKTGFPPLDETWAAFLRGDEIKASIRPYFHPNLENHRRMYLAHAPILWQAAGSHQHQ
ncbi:MAG: tyrosine-type recombinase/integrase, partial [Halobacteriales archaeon]|nr:tyrosine-type recombinase/integrase [Halobacteriales archaeon]